MRTVYSRPLQYQNVPARHSSVYCETDVVSLERLLPAMAPKISLPHALLRGRYMAAVARMEYAGIPIDAPILDSIRTNWKAIKQGLVDEVNNDFGVYEGTTFKQSLFLEYLIRHNIQWPLLATGKPKLDERTFQEQTALHPELRALKDLRYTLSQLRLNDLAVGKDGRNRTLLSPFATKTSRNAPSNSKFILGPASWLRSLIQPAPGTALAYIDYAQQEFGIAAALSGDPAMSEAYQSGDPYLSFGKQAGVIPPLATKESHRHQREAFKTCALGVLYGIGVNALAARIGRGIAEAQSLLNLHHLTFRQFWKWGDKVLDRAVLDRRISTLYGWTYYIGYKPSHVAGRDGSTDLNPRSLRNYPMQGNGAEMLRLACIFATEAGVRVLAPVHDAVLIEADIGLVNNAVETMSDAMGRASELVLAGFRLKTDCQVFAYPEHYKDRKGHVMWERIKSVLAQRNFKIPIDSTPYTNMPTQESGDVETEEEDSSISLHTNRKLLSIDA
jgi:DNA polymerase-1